MSSPSPKRFKKDLFGSLSSPKPGLSKGSQGWDIQGDSGTKVSFLP